MPKPDLEEPQAEALPASDDGPMNVGLIACILKNQQTKNSGTNHLGQK